MDWGRVAKKVADIGSPVVANLLTGNPVGAVTSMVAGIFGCKEDPDAVAAAMDRDPDAALKIRKMELDNKVQLESLALQKAQVESQERMNALTEVNKTMRAESQSEHWAQWLWRPFNGFLFPVTTIAVYVVLPLCGKPVPSIPMEVWVGFLAILGVASWDRGKEKRIAAGEQKGPGLIAKTVGAIRGGQ